MKKIFRSFVLGCIPYFDAQFDDNDGQAWIKPLISFSWEMSISSLRSIDKWGFNGGDDGIYPIIWQASPCNLDALLISSLL